MLLPLTVVTLLLAVGALGFRAAGRRGYRPFVIGLVAAALVVVGKFAVESALLTHGGMALLIAASLWNSWPPRRPARPLIQLTVQKGDPRKHSQEDRKEV